jgi:tyrosine-protein kinase Etk/Wzc
MVESQIDRVETLESRAVPSGSTEEDDDSVDLAEVFRKLARGKRTIIQVTLVVFAFATVVAFLLPFRYTSTTSFIPPANLGNGNSMAAMVAGQLSAMGAGDLLGSIKNPGDLYAGILKSHSIADALIKRFDLMKVFKVRKESQAEKILAASTDVTVDLKSSIVTVDVTAKSPGLARDLANGYMDALRDTNGRLTLSQSSQRRLFFGQQLAKEKDDLEEAEVDLKKTEEQSGLIAPAGQTEAEITTIAQTQAQIAVREVQLAALRDSATEQNPEVIRLRSEIGDLQGQLARLQRGSGKESTAAIPTSKVPEIQLEYVRKEREVKYHEALFDMLSRQYEAARLDEARDAPVLQVLDAASYPDTKSSPKRSYYMAGGLAFGFIASCVWVLTRKRIESVRASLVSSART